MPSYGRSSHEEERGLKSEDHGERSNKGNGRSSHEERGLKSGRPVGIPVHRRRSEPEARGLKIERTQVFAAAYESRLA